MSTTSTLPRTMSPLPTTNRFDTPFVAHMAREALADSLDEDCCSTLAPLMPAECQPIGRKRTIKSPCDSVGICICSPATQWLYSRRNPFFSVTWCVFKSPVQRRLLTQREVVDVPFTNVLSMCWKSATTTSVTDCSTLTQTMSCNYRIPVNWRMTTTDSRGLIAEGATAFSSSNSTTYFMVPLHEVCGS